jgi:glycerate 2-kinase
MDKIKEDAIVIIKESLKAVLPDIAVVNALKSKDFSGNIIVVAIGKAAWNMANVAKNILGDKVSKGIVITKYGHSKGKIKDFEIIEAGHPIPDENSVKGACKALEMVKSLTNKDNVILLISGGGSALFEKPMGGITIEDIMNITNQLLKCGANIVEINTIRKHLSAVKGGRFGSQCKAKIYAIVLSDVLGDRLDSIASGPTYPDNSTSEEAIKIIEKYKLNISSNVRNVLKKETPKKINNCETVIAGSVSSLCESAARIAEKLGYMPVIITSSLDCEAREAGKFLSSIAREIKKGSSSKFFFKTPCAIIAGGETIVHISGKGKGGRNQELALSAAIGIKGLKDTVIFSLGSDGTDGPTDAAGGIVDGTSYSYIKESGISPEVYLDNNNSYNALKTSNDLILTGPTGTNVNDLMVLLCK